MYKKNVVVTGGAGFIGSHLIDQLVESGHSVTVIDNFSTGRPENIAHQQGRVRIIEVDITNFDAIFPHFKDQDIVFHLAALADIVPSIVEPRAYYLSNVLGTMNVVEAARLAKIQKLIYAASSSCYGIPPKEFYPTSEIAPINPQHPYALTKYLGEQTALRWGQIYDLSVTSLRFFNVYGPRSKTSGTYEVVFGTFLAQKLVHKPFTIVGDGNQTRDFIYVTDVANAMIAASFSQVKNEIFNVGTGTPQSINTLASLLDGEKIHIPKRPGEPDCTWADIRKIKTILHWKPEISFSEGVQKILQHINYWKEAPVWTPDRIEKATEDWFKYLARN